MSQLSLGIVGLPNVGKSTLFNALTRKSVPAMNYPFCTIDPSVGIVPVPDPRLTQLANLSHSLEVIPAVVEFVDIAGLVEGASKGEGLGNKFLHHIREVDALVHVVRIFAVDDGLSTKINHVYGEIDPLRDIQVILMELILSDMETLSNRRMRIEKDVRRGDAEALAEEEVLSLVLKTLEAEDFAWRTKLTDEQQKIMKSWQLLTAKKMLFTLNKRSGGVNLDVAEPERFLDVIKYIESLGARYVVIDAQIEHELNDFEDNEKSSMRSDLYGIEEDGINELIRQGYELLDLMTFFTTGDKETRAWQITRGDSAPVSAGKIHGDFEKNFIRAEVIPWNDLIGQGGWGPARSSGLLRLEGKDYIVNDGDVMVIRHGA